MNNVRMLNLRVCRNHAMINTAALSVVKILAGHHSPFL